MHATAYHDNVQARLFGHAAGLAVTGSPVQVYQGQGAARERVPATGAWVRWSFEPIGATRVGRFDADEVARVDAALLIADLYWPVSTANAYEVVRAASELADAFELLSLSFLDYVSDPSSPPTVADARIRVLDPPRVRALPTADGYDRRRVEIVATWISRFSA